jgi:hypothetical protein
MLIFKGTDSITKEPVAINAYKIVSVFVEQGKAHRTGILTTTGVVVRVDESQESVIKFLENNGHS